MKTLLRIAVFVIAFYSSVSAQLSFDTFYKTAEIVSGKLNCVVEDYGNVYAAGGNGFILFSPDGGSNWRNLYPGFYGNINSLLMNSGNRIYAACSGGTVLYGYMAGTEWLRYNTGITEDLNSITLNSNTLDLITVGDNGRILRSSNSGNYWVSIAAGVTANLNDVKYNPSGYFYYYVCGDNGTIIKIKQTPVSTVFVKNSGTNNNLNSILPLDTSTLIIAGDNGTILRTTNGGVNWITVNPGASVNLKYITRSGKDSSKLFAGGDDGALLVSTDKGITWNGVAAGINGTITGISAGKLFTFAVTGSGAVYKCSNTPDMTGLSDCYQIPFSTKRINTYINTWGTFNKDVRITNSSGFSWPSDSNRFAVYSAGLTIAAKFNNIVRMSSASFMGEYRLGAMSGGLPVQNPYFMIYSIRKGDNAMNNIWYANWDKMVPFGAPYIDVNNNGIYEPNIDTPGVRNARQTVFAALTDGYPGSHSSSEGFAGGYTASFCRSEVNRMVLRRRYAFGCAVSEIPHHQQRQYNVGQRFLRALLRCRPWRCKR